MVKGVGPRRGVVVNDSGQLGGTGTIPGPVIIHSGGSLTPGASPGILGITPLAKVAVEALRLEAGSTFRVELNGTTAGTGHDQANVTGTVSLDGATLDVSVGFTPAAGDSFVIINNDDIDAVTGTFAGLPEGATFTPVGSSQSFLISYVGGDGNDVVLIAQAPPNPGSTPTGDDVVVQPVDTTTGATVGISFDNVTTSGTTSLTVSSQGPPPPTGFKLSSTPPTYFDITTTAVFDGSATVAISYARISVQDPSKLKLFHYENGAWVDRTTFVDTTNQVIYATVTSFSPFAIFEISIPIAGNDTASVSEDSSVIVSVLGNDSGEGITITGFTQGTRGSVVLNANGTFTYTPGVACDGQGIDSFTYTLTDAHGGTATATVTITITQAVQDGAVTVDGSGVVRVGGTAGDDTLVLTAAGGYLFLNGVDTGIALASVTEIRVWGRGGNDAIDPQRPDDQIAPARRQRQRCADRRRGRRRDLRRSGQRHHHRRHGPRLPPRGRVATASSARRGTTSWSRGRSSAGWTSRLCGPSAARGCSRARPPTTRRTTSSTRPWATPTRTC